MIFSNGPITQRKVTWTMVLTFLFLVFSLVALPGCIPPPSRVPAKYVPRETENGVFIFEYDPGNQGVGNGDSLSLFMEAMNQFKKDHPDLEVKRLENINTTVNYRNSQGQNATANVVHVLVYTQPPRGKQ